MSDINVRIKEARDKFLGYFSGFTKTTADTISWLSIVVLNLVFVPSYVAVMSGITDKMPQLDVALIVWTGLLLFFIRSAILKDMLMVFTIGVGFALQVILLGMTFFV